MYYQPSNDSIQKAKKKIRADSVFITIVAGSLALVCSSCNNRHSQTSPRSTGLSVTDLGTLGGKTSEARGINNRGQITGGADSVEGGRYAFLWQNGKMLKLGALPGSNEATGYAINTAGEVVGFSIVNNPAADPSPHGFLYKAGKMLDLTDLTLTMDDYAVGINNAGEVVGCDQQPRYSSSFLYTNGRRTNIDFSSAYAIQAYGINNQGDITGRADFISGRPSVFLLTQGKLRNLGILPGYTLSIGGGINDKRQIIGKVIDWSNRSHAILYDGKTMIDIGGLGGENAAGSSINNKSEVVGGATIPDETLHAFLYRKGKMVDLNSLLSENDSSHWVLETAHSINDKDQIVGVGEHDGTTRGFLLAL